MKIYAEDLEMLEEELKSKRDGLTAEETQQMARIVGKIAEIFREAGKYVDQNKI